MKATILTAVTLSIALVAVMTSPAECRSRPTKGLVTYSRTSRRPISSRICQYRSKYVVCPGMGKWFRLNMVSKSAVMILLNNNQLRTLEPWIMRRFRNLRYLEVSDNDIESFKGSLVRNKNLISLVANNNKLGMSMGQNEGALKGVFKSNTKLQIASVRQNGIRKLSSVIVERRNNNMKSLDVSRNIIERITRHTTANMGNLERLDLHQNNIAFLHKAAFKKNRKLQQLDLSGNRISFTGWNNKLDLTSNRNLLAFYIQDNRLGSLREVDLSRSRELEKLDVAMNRIRWLGRNELSRNPNLLNFNASYNRIRTVNPGGFRYLRNLHTLDLSGNQLTYLHSYTLKNLKNLQVLKLTYNGLRQIHPDTFVGNGRLVALDLRGNALVAWQPLVVHSNINLKILDLRDNNFAFNRTQLMMRKEKVVKRKKPTDDSYYEQFDGDDGAMPQLSGREIENNLKLLKWRAVLGRLQCLRVPAPSIKDKTEGGGVNTSSKKPCFLTGQPGHVFWQCGCGRTHQSEDDTYN